MISYGAWLVSLYQGVSEMLQQKGFDQAVAAHQAQGFPTAPLRKGRATVRLVVG